MPHSFFFFYSHKPFLPHCTLSLMPQGCVDHRVVVGSGSQGLHPHPDFPPLELPRESLQSPPLQLLNTKTASHESRGHSLTHTCPAEVDSQHHLFLGHGLRQYLQAPLQFDLRDEILFLWILLSSLQSPCGLPPFQQLSLSLPGSRLMALLYPSAFYRNPPSFNLWELSGPGF